MDKLDAAALNKLFNDNPTNQPLFEITNLDIKRLRDDLAEIQLGDEVAFVATAKFRVTTAVHDAPAVFKDLAIGDPLFEIAADGEIISSRVVVDVDSVPQWLAAHYDFKFHLNGSAKQPFSQIGPARPWVQKLHTAAVKDDYIDIDVQIEPIKVIAPDKQPNKALAITLASGSQPARPDRVLVADLMVHVSEAALAANRARTIPLALEGCNDIRIYLSLHEDPSDPPGISSATPAPSPAAAAPRSHSHHKS